MRFSVTTTSLISLVLGSSTASAYNPAYVQSWGVEVDTLGRLGRAGSPLCLDNGEIYMANSTNHIDNPVLRFQLIGMMNRNFDGTIISTAKIVEYPGYSINDEGFYVSQPVGGRMAYSTFGESPGLLGSWWLVPGPSNDPQFRLSLNGNSTAKVLWDDSKGRYGVYIGTDIPADRVSDMYEVYLKVTAYCGLGNTYCTD